LVGAGFDGDVGAPVDPELGRAGWAGRAPGADVLGADPASRAPSDEAPEPGLGLAAGLAAGPPGVDEEDAGPPVLGRPEPPRDVLSTTRRS
jgi:hypothetical protein